MNAKKLLLALTVALSPMLSIAAATDDVPPPDSMPTSQTQAPDSERPMGGPDGAPQIKMMKGHKGGPGVGRPNMPMMNTDVLKNQLDQIKDPKVKAKFISMVKAHIEFEQAQLESTKVWLSKQ